MSQTRHFISRIQQRGILQSSIEVAQRYGFPKGDKFILEKKYHKNIKAYIIGSNNFYFINEFKNKINFKYSKNLKNAILTIKNDIKKDKKKKTILFSPAAASFDQFKNFEHRGRYFNSLIKKIGLYGK